MLLAHLNVLVGVTKLDRINKREPSLVPLIATARAVVSSPTTTEPRLTTNVAAAGATL